MDGVCIRVLFSIENLPGLRVNENVLIGGADAADVCGLRGGKNKAILWRVWFAGCVRLTDVASGCGGIWAWLGFFRIGIERIGHRCVSVLVCGEGRMCQMSKISVLESSFDTSDTG